MACLPSARNSGSTFNFGRDADAPPLDPAVAALAVFPLDLRWKITDLLGSGSEALVCKATDLKHGAQHAVKLLHEKWHANSSVVKQFFDGAQAQAQVQGPYVPRLIDSGNSPPHGPYAVMDYIDGKTLRDWIDECDLLNVAPDLLSVVRYGCAVGRALAAAHARGVKHNDTKPANVLLPATGRPAAMLIDWTLACGPGAAPVAFAGTPAFAAPEVLRNEPPTTASDMHALGVTLYYAAIGSDARNARRAGVTVCTARPDIVPAQRARYRACVELSALIENLMSTDPRSRPSAIEAVRHLVRLRERLRRAGAEG